MSSRLKTAFNAEAVINWFPGHMAKAARIIKETLKKVDTVIEVRDARVRFDGNLSQHKVALIFFLFFPHRWATLDSIIECQPDTYRNVRTT
jgi:hypothetical protein